MRKSMKQVLSLVLVVAMVLSLGVLPASAAGLDEEDVDIVTVTEPVAEEPAREVDEVNYPAQQFSYYEPNGLNIDVKAPAGALPRGTTMEVSRLEDLAAVQNAVDRAEDLDGSVVLAADISFWNEGKEIEPQEGNKILVTMTAPEIAELMNPVVVHVPDEEPAVAERVDPLPNDDDASLMMADQIVFEAEEFSVYAVIGDNETDENARLEVRFFHHDTDAEPVYSVYVKQRDINDLGTIIEDPEVPTVTENKLFCGWYINETDYHSADYTADDVDGRHTIDWVRDMVKTRLNSAVAEGDYINVYAMVFNYFNVAYLDENGETTLATDVYYSKEDTLTVNVQLTYAPYLQGYRFLGWQKDDGDDTVYENGETAEITQRVTKFRAMVQQGFWLSFEENPGNHYTGATYVPPVFCPNGVIPANAQPTDPRLNGYTLGGSDGGKWYTKYDDRGTADVSDDVWSNEQDQNVPFSFSGTIDKDTTVYAKWVLQDTVNFTIIVWKQNIDDDRSAVDTVPDPNPNNLKAKTYDYAFARTKSVAPNTPVADLINDANIGLKPLTELSWVSSYTVDGIQHSFYGFEYNETKGVTSTDTVVKADGTTVINLYYDRYPCTVRFMTQQYSAVSGHPSTSSGTPVYYIYYNNQYCPIRYYSSSYNYVYLPTTASYNTQSTQYAVVDGVWYQLDYRRFSDGNYYWSYLASDNKYHQWSGTRYYEYGHGSTTSYTYYTRDWAEREVMTGLYDQPLSKYNYTWPTDYRWMVDDPNGSSFISVLDCFAGDYTLYGVEEAFTANAYHFLQDENGNYNTLEADADFTIPCKTSDGMVFRSFSGFASDQYRVKLPSGVTTYQVATGYTTSGSGNATTYTFNWGSAQNRIYDRQEGGYWTDWIDDGVAVKFDGFEPNDISHIKPAGGKIEFRYSRVKMPITFMYGAFVTGRGAAMPAPVNGQIYQTAPIFYQASVDSYKKDGGTNYYDPVVKGDFTDETFLFEGWYIDPSCTTEYDFAGKTMLQGGITVYAKFRQREFRVFLHVNEENKEWSDVSWNDPDQASNFRIAYNDKISDGNPVEGTMEGYVLVGWYTDEACTKPFNFQTKFTDAMGDDILQDYGATEKANAMYATEADGTNKDVNRPWINKMVHLYAKWRKVLDGSTGITVKYDAVEEVGVTGKTGTLIGTDGSTATTYTDPLRYTDGSDALSHSAATPDDSTNYQFLYWQILDKQGNPVSSEEGGIVYPGMTFTVDADYAVVSDAPSAGTASVDDGLISIVAGDTAASPMGSGVVNPVRAATDVYQAVTTPQIGHSYLLGYVSDSTTVYLIGNTYYNASNCPMAVSATYDNGTINGDYSAYLWTVGGNTSALTFQNATAGYLGRKNNYLVFGETQNTWTYTGNKLVNVSTSGSRNIGYDGYFDVYRTGSNITFFELVNQGDPVTYTKVDTPVPGISYVIVADGANYALSGTNHTNTTNASTGSSWLNGTKLERSGNTVTIYSNQVADLTWTAGGNATSGWTWQNVGNSKYLNLTTTGYLTVLTGSIPWLYDSNNYFNNQIESEGYYYLTFDDSNTDGYYDYTVSKNGEAIGIYALTHTLTINYVMSDGTTAPAAHVGAVPEGVPYTVDSPELDGYTASQTSVSGTMGTSDVTVTVTYTRNSHTVTFNWHDGSKTQTVDHGGYATVPEIPSSYTVDGKTYLFDHWDPNPNTTEITADQIFTAQYRREGAFIVTFKDWNGRVLKTEEVTRGESATAPADPTREGFTFKGWDKDFTNVQTNLVVYATYATKVTKIYTVTLRAVYGPKSIQRPTHIVWYANNGTGDYKESKDVKINGNIEIPLPSTDYTEGSVYVGWDKIVWEGHEFLGWARVAESDMEGNLYWSSPDNHPEELSLTEDDLFLRYNPETKSYSAVTTVSSTIWTTVKYVAPDELMPYHAMYAVWGKVVYVYHSGDNTIERITVPNGTTLDIANHVTSGYLYGGFYTDYAGTTIKNIVDGDSDTVKEEKLNALKALSWNPVQPAADSINATTGEPTEIATVFDILASKGWVKKAQVAVDGVNVKNYDGTTATAVWDSTKAYTTESEVGNGLTLNPVAGTIYYIKEVPATEFLQPRLRYTYNLGTGAIATAWLFTNTDDANYGDVGFVFDNGSNNVKNAVGDKSKTEFEVSPVNKTSNAVTYFIGEPTKDESATYKRLFQKAGMMSYRLVYTNLAEYPENRADYPDLEYIEVNDLQVGKPVYMFWVTPDNLIVTSATSRVYGSLNYYSIGTATTKPARTSTVDLYVAPESGT